MRPLFLDNHWSDLIETYQVYCWGPVDVPFQGLILIGQVQPGFEPQPSYNVITGKVIDECVCRPLDGCQASVPSAGFSW